MVQAHQAKGGRSQESTGFLDVPAELRNSIYYDASIDALHAQVEHCRPPSLLCVSRQVRREFASVYYSRDFMTVERSTPSGWHVVEDTATLTAMLNMEKFKHMESDEVLHMRLRGPYEANRYSILWTRYRSGRRDGLGAKRVVENMKDPIIPRPPIGDLQRVDRPEHEPPWLLFEFLGAITFAKASGIASRVVWKLANEYRELHQGTAEEQLKAFYARRIEEDMIARKAREQQGES